MSPGTKAVVVDGLAKPTPEKKEDEEPKRDTWGKKIDFLLSVIGFAVDLGNVWRFPYICYKNGGGAFLVPYLVMLMVGGLPMFYMELVLGQFQRCGCISIWKRICPMFKGIGFGICVIASYVAMYYNTIIAWSVYYLFSSFARVVPWAKCNHPWNTVNCTDSFNLTAKTNWSTSPAEEFYFYKVLRIDESNGIGNVGGVKWDLALCLLAVFAIVYFSLWKGIKSSGKAVWVTATLPYVVLFILLVRGLTLPGSHTGIMFYLTPRWNKLANPEIWIAAAQQTFFSLGPGFGVLLALSSYNKFENNCYKDALVVSLINCATSFLSGFVVFSVLGYMAFKQGKAVSDVAEQDAGLIFAVYPEAIATLNGSTFWAIIFFLMLITLGLDSTFGGLEALITGVCDEWPYTIGRKRELFVFGLICYCFFGALPTTTFGGNYIVNLLDNHGPPISILFICFLETIAVNWFYGVNRFCGDIERMLGFRPGFYWRFCWAFVTPLFVLTLFVLSFVFYRPLSMGAYEYPPWAAVLGWVITCSSLVPIPIYIVYRYLNPPKDAKNLYEKMVKPEERPRHADGLLPQTVPVYL